MQLLGTQQIMQHWEITGLQLEVGQTATDFEHRSFGQELELMSEILLLRFDLFQFWITVEKLLYQKMQLCCIK